MIVFRSIINTNNLSVAIANDNDLGVLHNCDHLSIGRYGVFDHNIHTISVHESLASIQFTMEEGLLIPLGQACNDANAPLYLVDVIMDIIHPVIFPIHFTPLWGVSDFLNSLHPTLGGQ